MCSPCICSTCGAVFIFSLEIGEDDGILEINRKLAGRVKRFCLNFCWSLSCFFLKVTVFFVVFVSPGRHKCCSDLSDKGVQRRWSKWGEPTHFLFTPSLLSKSSHDQTFPKLVCQRSVQLGDYKISRFRVKTPVKSHCKPINLFSIPIS